jgi:hypothetical protein
MDSRKGSYSRSKVIFQTPEGISICLCSSCVNGAGTVKEIKNIPSFSTTFMLSFVEERRCLCPVTSPHASTWEPSCCISFPSGRESTLVSNTSPWRMFWIISWGKVREHCTIDFSIALYFCVDRNKGHAIFAYMKEKHLIRNQRCIWASEEEWTDIKRQAEKEDKNYSKYIRDLHTQHVNEDVR